MSTPIARAVTLKHNITTIVGAVALAAMLVPTTACDTDFIVENITSEDGMLDNLEAWVTANYPRVVFVRTESHCDLIPLNERTTSGYSARTCLLATRPTASSSTITTTLWVAADRFTAIYFHLETPEFDPELSQSWDKVRARANEDYRRKSSDP